MTEPELFILSQAFRALSQPRRLALFREVLSAGESGVELARLRAGAERPSTLSMHLKALHRGRLIFETEDDARRVHADFERVSAAMSALRANDR